MLFIVYSLLKPSQNPTRHEPDVLNRFFVGTAERALGTNNSAIPSEDLPNVIKDLPAHENDVHPFNLRPVTYHEVLQVSRALRLDCSTGPDFIPARFIKMAASVIASPLTNIINNSISKFLRLITQQKRVILDRYLCFRFCPK